MTPIGPHRTHGIPERLSSTVSACSLPALALLPLRPFALLLSSALSACFLPSLALLLLYPFALFTTAGVHIIRAQHFRPPHGTKCTIRRTLKRTLRRTLKCGAHVREGSTTADKGGGGGGGGRRMSKKTGCFCSYEYSRNAHPYLRPYTSLTPQGLTILQLNTEIRRTLKYDI